MSLGTLRDLEQGRTRQPRASSLARVATVLGLDLEVSTLAAGTPGRPGADHGGALGDDGPRRAKRRGGRVWVQVLGPLEVWRHGTRIPIAVVRHQVVLGVLALAVNQVVSRDALISAVWGEDPPASAVSLIQGYVSALRRLVDPGRGARDPNGVLAAVGMGYRLRLSARQLDLLAFREHARTAHALRTSGARQACRVYEQALALWSGDVLAGVGALAGHPAVTGARREWAELICGYADAATAAGLPGQALPWLRQLTAAEPLHEPAHARLMLALAAAGQQAEALAVFAGLRHRLDAELGVIHGAEVSAAHLRILRLGAPLAGVAEHQNGEHAARVQAAPRGRLARAAGREAVLVRPAVDVFPVAVGHYTDPRLPDLDAAVRTGRLVDVLAPFGGRHRAWGHPARDRSADAVQQRLREWPGPSTLEADGSAAGTPAMNPSAGSSVLYWVGHSWSDGAHAVLAHAESPAVVGGSGVEPQQLAQAIRARQAAAGRLGNPGEAGGWALVIVETTHAAEIADAVMAALHGPAAPGRLLLVAAPAEATALAGGFAAVLAGLLAGPYRADERILLRDLAAELERRLGAGTVHQRGLGEAALVRAGPPEDSPSVPVGTIRHLEEVLADLPPDERGHFLLKAQGGEHGEPAWFFEGREAELAQIAGWLHEARPGLCVVTGPAGAGKSALLGTVLVRSRPALRDALARRGLTAGSQPGPGAPPKMVFDAVVHLRGLDLAQVTTRIAAAAQAGPLPSSRDPEAGVASDLDFLTGELAGRERPFTVLADALDESRNPLDIARSLLARIAALPTVRVLVGTRASTGEAPDTPTDDQNLLSALVSGSLGFPGQPSAGAPDRGEPGPDRVVWVRQDPAAISRYVTGRLRAARSYGLAGRAIPHMAEVTDEDIALVAAEIARRGQEFLFARLAVHELIADPRLITPGRAHSRRQLLQGTHQDLFGRAVHRLAGHDDRYPLLLRALSLAHGRGLPEADGIWAAIATALAPPPAGRAGCAPDPCAAIGPGAAADWADAISKLLGQAAAYITTTTVTGHDGPAGAVSVYRLAHHTFVEYFTRYPAGQPNAGARQRAAAALLHAAAHSAAAGPGRLPAYLAQHLPGHAAEAGRWDDLASLPHVLDRIDPHAVTTYALHTLFGHSPLPPPIAGIIGARDALTRARPADRPGLRHLATTRHSSCHVISEPTATWGVAAAQIGHATIHITLSDHKGAVNGVLSFVLPDGRTMLASCSDDGTIRLWDPVTATPASAPIKGHAGSVEAMCALPARTGRATLASAGTDGTIRLWDLATGAPAGPPLTGHTGTVWTLCVVPGPEPGQPARLASAGVDGTIRLWDPATGAPAGPPLTGHTGSVYGVCVVPGQPAILASAGVDGTIRLWDLTTGQPAGPPLTGHTGTVYGVCVVPGQPAILASAGVDGTIRLWDPATGAPAGPPLTGHTGSVRSVSAVPGRRPGQPSLLASTGRDGTVRLWDPATGHPAGPPLTGHTGTIADVCVVPGHEPGQPARLASAGVDGTVRLWDPATGAPTSPPFTTGYTGTVAGVCVVPGQPTLLASAGRDGTVRLWDLATGQPAGPPLTGHTGPVYSVCIVPGRRSVLASAGDDGTVRLWDPATGAPTGPPLTGHTGPVAGVCTVPGDPALLASAGLDGTVRLWDPATGAPTGPPLTGHTGPVRIITAVPGGQPGQPTRLASAGDDGTVRLWDPATGAPTGPPLTGHTGPGAGLCVVPGQPPRLASAGVDGTIRLWDPATGAPTGPPIATGHTGTVYGICLVPGPEPGQPARLASTGGDGTVRLWDPATGAPTGPPIATGHTGTVYGICVVAGPEPSQPTLLASTGTDGTVRLWDTVARREASEPLARSPETVSGLARCPAAIADCVTAHGDGTVRTWIAAGATLHTVQSPPDVSAITTLASTDQASTDQASLVAGDSYGHVHLSDLRTGHQPGPPLRISDRAVLALCPLSTQPPAARIAAADGSGTITIITVSPTGRLQPGPALRGPAGPIRALCLTRHPDGRPLLAAAGNDAAIWIWDLTKIDDHASGPRPAVAPMAGPLTGHTGWIWSLTAIPAHHGSPPRLASAGADGTLRRWDPHSGRPFGQPLTGHTGQVRAVTTAISGDGRLVLVSGSHDGTIRLWDPVTGAPGALIPLGIPVHSLLQQHPDPTTRERTDGGATITAGLRTGILALDLNQALFPLGSAPR